jgi:hypothetical protein
MILRTELRRSTAPVLGIGLLLLALGLLYGLSGPWGKRTAHWDEQWIGLAQWTRYLALFLTPLVLAGGAWQGMRDRRSGVPELFASTPRAAWRRVLPTVAALGITLTAGYVALLVVGGVQVAGTASYFHLKWVPVAGVMVVALVGIALLGAGIGRLAPSLVTPPLLGVGGLVGQFSLLQSGWPQWLTPAFDTPDITVFTTVAVPLTLTQTLWFLGVGATGFGLLVASRARTRMFAALPVLLAAAVTVPVLSGLDSPVVADPDARALVCDDDGPRVCLTRAHADYLPVFVEPAREALALMEKLPSPPTAVVEVAPAEDVPSGVAPVSFPMRFPTDPTELRMIVLSGADVPECGQERNWEALSRILVARTVVASWFAGELTTVPGYQYIGEAAEEEIRRSWQELQALPVAEQPSRVAALREAAVFCRGTL